MDPIIEILSKNVITNKNYDRYSKENYILIINRISSFKLLAQQLYRQNAYHTLYNAFHEEIFFLTEKKNILKKKLTGNTLLIFNDFIDNQIQIYNHYMHKL
jgi:hypothetical protein